MTSDVLHTLLVGWLALAAAAIAPGPNLLTVATTALGDGKKLAVFVAAGVATGTFLWAIAAVLGLTWVFFAYPWSVDLLRIAGGLYLVFLGLKAIRAGLRRGRQDVAPAASGISPWRALRRGFTVVATNPKSLLAWTAIAALVVAPDTPLATGLVFAAVSMVISFSIYASYAVVFSLPALRRRYRSIANRLEIVFGALFCLFGARLLAGR